MGDQAILQQAVDAATNDMGNVQAAADAISSAISAAQQYMDPQTWQGAAASAWEGDWASFYRGVQNCLTDLPAAEASVINETRTQMEQILAKQHQSA
jgi:uncharacterized protein YukE